MNTKTAVIIFNEADDYVEVSVAGGQPRRYGTITEAAIYAGLSGATEVEAREVDGEQLAQILFWFGKAQERKAKLEAQAAKASRRAFHGKAARHMSRDRFGKFRGLALEY
jgi:hypothetical protein